MEKSSLPISTQWLLDSIGESGRAAVDSVFMVVCRKTGQKGSAFLLDTGYVITNEHVVRGCTVSDVILVSNSGTQHRASNLVSDPRRDLVAMCLDASGGLGLKEGSVDVGVQVATWGYPLGYSGPAPLLTVGYLSGFVASQRGATTVQPVKHLVVNGAFNPGNSGGPLFLAGDDSVIGVVVSKHAPIPRFLAQTIEVLAKNRSGLIFAATDDQGNKREFSESQLVAEVLYYFRQMTQVVIGEAIAVSELIAFLDEQRIPWTASE